jgi:phosphatidylglycerol:prolipoprotein diacylglycerol transferase
MRVKADPDLVVNLGFAALLASVVGARLFYVLHYWDDHFAGRGLWAVLNVTAGGLEFYGGFLGALAAGLGYMLYRRVSVRLYLDIVVPSIMFGMSMARIGCFLNGCCWGGVCPTELPWSVQFPFASPAFYREWEERRLEIPAELIYVTSSGLAYPLPRDWLDESAHPAKQNSPNVAYLASHAQRFQLSLADLRKLAFGPEHRSMHLHPAQLYASIGGMLLAILLNTLFYRRKRHGIVFAVFLMIYPVQRFVEEAIRIDNPHDTAGLTISQFVSLLLFAAGLAMLLWLRKQPLRSPRAVPFVAPWAEPAAVAATAQGRGKGR